MFKLITNKIYVYLPILYIAIVAYLVSDFYYHDASFPLEGYSNDLKNKFIYIWTDQFLGTDTLIEKLRSPFRFILNCFGYYNPGFFYFFIFLFGYFSSYVFLSLFRVSKIKRGFISLFFVFNPFVINHMGHFLILQGYYITPFLLYLYYKIFFHKDIINIYLILFIITTLLLGQPHNYSNLIVVILIINIFFIFIYKGNVFYTLKKNIILLFFILLSFSFFLFPAISLIGSNSMIDSTSDFSKNLMNIHYSKNNNLFEIFQISNLQKLGLKLTDDLVYQNLSYIYGLFIGLLVGIIIFGFFIYYKKSRLKISITLGLIFSIFFILIHKIDLGIINNIMYILMPHIGVSTNYAIPIFIFILIIILGICKKNILTYILVLLIQIYCLIVFTFSPFFNINNFSLIEKYNKDSIELKKDNELGYELLLPLKSRQLLEGFNYKVSVLIFNFDVFSFKNLSIEQMLKQTRISIRKLIKENNLNNLLYNYPFKKIIIFNDTNLELSLKNNNLLGNFHKFNAFSSFDNLVYKGLLRVDNNSNSKLIIKYNRNTPVEYTILVKNLDGKFNLNFLESFHQGWEIYIENKSEMIENNCIVSSQYTYNNANVINCKKEYDSSFFGNFNLLTQKDILLKNSNLNKEYFFNNWTISKDYFLNNIDNKNYEINKDGSLNIRLKLYFKPQLYFNIGMIISGTTFLLLILWLIVDSVKNRKKKEEIKKI